LSIFILAEKPLEEAIKGKDLEVEWIPYELRPYPNEILRPEGTYLQNTWKQSILTNGCTNGYSN
jgi:hypothetical protein